MRYASGIVTLHSLTARQSPLTETDPMATRIVHAGHLQGVGPVFATITYDGTRLSITGVVAPKRNGDADRCGQIVDTLRDAAFTACAGVDALQLAAYWDAWHLNDMRAACEHQRALGQTWTTHPSAICDTCGYALGSAWLFEAVPRDVIEWLFSLPASDALPPRWR